jgi:6-phosphogluconolactonase
VDGGNYPRSVNFDPAGRFLYWGNRRGDNVAVFRVIHETGALVFTRHDAPVGHPSSIVFSI